jgi:hypothetical protein
MIRISSIQHVNIFFCRSLSFLVAFTIYLINESILFAMHVVDILLILGISDCLVLLPQSIYFSNIMIFSMDVFRKFTKTEIIENVPTLLL